MKYTKLFRELNRNDAAIAGGKGASLGEMLNAGIPVPDGYVVLSTTFDKFIEDTDLVQEIDAILDSVDHKEIHTVEGASEKIKGLILSREMPHDIAEEIKTNFKSLGTKFVAVRSSATAEDGAEHAWAGQLESYLNTTDKDLLDKVKHCWASLFTPRAIFYRFEKGLHSTRISVAVVVQKMVESEVSGIAFSVHPVTEDRNQLIIEAGFGLGEAIVSGSVTPDSYVVEKIPRRVIDKNISTQERGLFRVETGGNEWRTINEPVASSQVLDEKQIFDLSEIIVGIENHYGFPCDIEWAYEKGKFYIVQSRPITTLSAPKQSNLPFDERIQKMFEEKRPLHCNVHYPKIPVINVEASLEALIKNHYYTSLGKEADLAGIMYMDKEFSYWNHIPSIPSISEIKFIEKIIVDTKKKIPEYKQDLQAVYNTSDEEMSKPEKVIESLKEVNRVSRELYVLFGLFIDEAFHVSEESVMQKLQEIRMQMDDVGVNYLYKAYDKIFKTLTDIFKIDKDIVINATTDDIIRMVSGTLNNPENLRERAIAYVLYKNKISVHYGEEAKAIYQYLLNQDPDKTLLEDAKKSNEIRGLVGHKGKAKGKVVKLSATDYRNKQKLDQLLSFGSFVLVAPMTVPELVPYFKNAVAFVTDEGGITCHAAIIARELNKPCVTGTRVATQTLKDGDMVEVDADKGVVRIVNVELEKKDLADEYLERIGNRKLYPPLNGYSAFLQGSEYNIEKYFGKWYENKVRYDFFLHMKDGYSQVWLPEDDVRGASDFGLREYLNKSKSFDRRIDFMDESIKYIDKIYTQYTYEKIDGTKLDKLFLLVNEVRDIIWDVNAAASFSIFFDKKMCENILIDEKYPITSNEIDILWDKAVTPAFESFDKVQLSHLLTLMSKSSKWESVLEECQYFLTDYHSAKTLSEIEKALKERYKKYIDEPGIVKETLKTETEEVARMISEHKKWLHTLPENEKKIANYLQIVMRVRDRRKNFFAKGMTIMYRVAEKVFREAGVDRNLIPYYTIRELLKGVDYLKSSVDDLKDRKNGFQWLVPYSDQPKKQNINIDSGVQKINNYFKECHLSDNNSSEIQGQCAYKGVIKGRVRIVLNVNSNHGFSDGEVLVAGMTRPEYVPLMKKAAAIITDEGGITCHAAIVSRELKKPCIIGTKIATKVLKDGDMVEVDADKGVVRIIK